MSNVSFVKVVDAGPGWTKVEASNGEVYTLKGDRNWRNNNPGNLEYGKFAKSKGAIGSDGRFAVFPTYEDGFKAQSDLQFESPRYRDLTISQAISRYAPSFENNTAAYAASVAAAAGASLDTKMSELTPQQRAAFLREQQRVEGFKVGRISGEDGKPVPASVARQFAAVPLPPVDIPRPSNANDIGEGATQGMLARFGLPGSPADMSRDLGLRTGRVAPTPMVQTASLQSRRNASDDIGEGATAGMLSRFGQPGAAPVTMSDEFGRQTGRIQDLAIPPRRPDAPMPRPRPPSLVPSVSRGIVDSVRSPTLFSEGVGIPNEQIPGSDATYSGANRMSTGGLGALLDPRSVSPAMPNPVPSTLPQPSGPTGRWRPVLSPSPVAPIPAGVDERLAARTRVASSDPSIGSAPPPRSSGNVRTADGIAGTVQLPRDVRPNVPQIGLPSSTGTMSSMGFSAGTVPKYLTKTIQVPNPDYKQVNPGNPTLAAMGFSPGTMPNVPKTIPKTIQVPNPAYVAAPVPATMSPALAAYRMAPAPVPAGVDERLASRTRASGNSASDYAAANAAAKSRAISKSSNPSKTAARASLAAQWGFD